MTRVIPSSFTLVLSLLLASLVVIQVHTIPIPQHELMARNASSHKVVSMSVSDVLDPMKRVVLASSNLEHRALLNKVSTIFKKKPAAAPAPPVPAPAPVPAPPRASTPARVSDTPPSHGEVDTGPNFESSVNESLQNKAKGTSTSSIGSTGSSNSAGASEQGQGAGTSSIGSTGSSNSAGTSEQGQGAGTSSIGSTGSSNSATSSIQFAPPSPGVPNQGGASSDEDQPPTQAFSGGGKAAKILGITS